MGKGHWHHFEMQGGMKTLLHDGTERTVSWPIPGKVWIEDDIIETTYRLIDTKKEPTARDRLTLG